MSKSKITMRQNSWNLKAGQTVEVDKETADRLVADGHAYAASGRGKSTGGE